MAFSRVAALRSAIRGARPSVARPQCFRQVVRRGYASGHSSTQAGGDTLWAVGAVAVTAPACWYILSNAPEPAHGHGDHGDSHGKEHEEEHEEESKDEEPKEESKDEGDDKETSSDAEEKDSDKSEDSDSGDEKEADTPDTSDDEGSDGGENKNTKKHIPDAKGGAKKRVESNNSIKAGKNDDSQASPSKEAGSKNTQTGKQEGLTNTDTKHSTDIGNDPSKSKKAEGGPDTAKVKGTVDVNRKQPEKK